MLRTVTSAEISYQKAARVARLQCSRSAIAITVKSPTRHFTLSVSGLGKRILSAPSDHCVS